MALQSRILLLLLSAGFFRAAAQPLPALIPYVDNGKWGYCDSNGKILIRPRWQEAALFYNGKAKVGLGGRHSDYYCLINSQGKYIIPPYRHWSGITARTGSGTEFNARTRNGNSVVIDSNNNELSPGLYRAVGSEHFGYRKGWSPYFKIVSRHGKKGIIDSAYKMLIPFEYDDIVLRRDIPVYYLEVAKHGRKGLIDTSNHVILPCRYDYINFDLNSDYRKGMRITQRGAATAYANLDGQVIFSNSDYSAYDAPVDTLISVTALHPQPGARGSQGVASLSGQIIVPAVYASVRITTDTITVWKDSLVASADTSASKALVHAYYIRYLSRKTDRYISNWVPPQPYIQPEPPTNPDTSGRVWMRMQGKDTFVFRKEGIDWKVRYCASPKRHYYVLQGSNAARPGEGWLAVVDTNGGYVIRPMEGSLTPGRLNPWDSLLVVSKVLSGDSLRHKGMKLPAWVKSVEHYGVAGPDGQWVLPLQQRRLFDAFYRQGQLYILAAFDDETQFFSIRLMDSRGKVVEGMNEYYVESYTNRFGLEAREAYEKFDGYFKVRSVRSNETHRYGSHIVDFNGRPQFPAVSAGRGFRQAVGDGYFLVDRYSWAEQDMMHSAIRRAIGREALEITGFMLVDSNGKEVFKDLPVKQVNRIPPLGLVFSANDHLLSGQPARPEEGYFYQIYYDNGTDETYDYRDFYMDRKGRGYHGRLKALRRHR